MLPPEGGDEAAGPTDCNGLALSDHYGGWGKRIVACCYGLRSPFRAAGTAVLHLGTAHAVAPFRAWMVSGVSAPLGVKIGHIPKGS
jgi:hypothetical protein